MTDAVIIGSIVASITGFLLILLSILISMAYFCTIYAGDRYYNINEIKFSLGRPEIDAKEVSIDEEQLIENSNEYPEVASNVILRQVPLNQNRLDVAPLSDGEILINISKDENVGELEYCSAINDLTNFLDSSFSTSDGMELLEPSDSQYDSFSRTLLLRNMMKNHDDCIIREVADPYLDSHISIGEIVVVVKPYLDPRGRHLKPGDLLRILKFHIKAPGEDDVDIPLANTDLSKFKAPEDLSIDRDDSVYEKIHCTGIILNTRLECNSDSHNITLKVRKGPYKELVLRFPLEIVSLETTVLSVGPESSSTVKNIA